MELKDKIQTKEKPLTDVRKYVPGMAASLAGAQGPTARIRQHGLGLSRVHGELKVGNVEI